MAISSTTWLRCTSNQGKYAEAEPLYKRALAIQEKALGADHPDVADTLNNLAILFASSGNSEKALAYSRKATASVIAHAATETTGAQHKEGAGGLVEQRTNYFVRHVANLAAAAQKRIEPKAQLGREALVMAQWAKQSSAAAAVQQMGLRFAAGSDALAALVRERQDLSAFWREPRQGADRGPVEAARPAEPSRDRRIAQSSSPRPRASLPPTRRGSNGSFPNMRRSRARSRSRRRKLQQLLGADEALVLLAQPGDKESYVFALTREGFEWKTIPLGAGRSGGESGRVPARARCGCAAARIATGGVHAGRSGQARAVADRVRSVVAKECEEARGAASRAQECKPAKAARAVRSRPRA